MLLGPQCAVQHILASNPDANKPKRRVKRDRSPYSSTHSIDPGLIQAFVLLPVDQSDRDVELVTRDLESG
jgi:hypothetical protein